jgi:hypothetical protein
VFVHMTVAKVDPRLVREAFQSLSVQVTICNSLKGKGLWQSFLIESLEEPGRLIWLSIWDTPGDAQAFFTSPDYAAMVARVRTYLVCEPEWYGYFMLKDES